MVKKLFSIALALVGIYLVYSMASGITHMQSCSVNSGDKRDWTCEQIAQNNAENCHYVILKWKKISYEEELRSCKVWESEKANK